METSLPKVASGFAAELTEIVGIQAIDRLQDSIRDGDAIVGCYIR